MISSLKALALAVSAPLLAAVLSTVATGCTNDAFCFADCSSSESASSGASSGHGGSGGGFNPAGTGGDCSPFCTTSASTGGQCQPTNNGVEICDGKDNDCNGMIDDVDPASPLNCGGCPGVNCFTSLINVDPTTVTCDAGVCKGSCAANYFDLDHDGTCEYFCQKVSDTDTTCDNRDDDCNGLKDDGVNTCTDAANCGGCGHNCVVLHGTGACSHDQATGCDTTSARCTIAACDCNGPGDCWHDADGSYATGCEYQCDVTSPFEICGDGIDNDCNGKIDSADDTSHDPKIGTPCHGGDSPDGTIQAQGICADPAHAGTWQCGLTGYECQGPNVIMPGTVPETCNNLDDDCDGVPDNNPTDAGAECGGAPNACNGAPCAPCQHGHIICTAGVLSCSGNIEPAADDGCDGIDNDCDGTPDNHPPASQVGPCDVPTPPPAGATSACHAGTYKCQAGVLICNGSAKVGSPPAPDTCNFDGNCDGLVPMPDIDNDPKNCGGCGIDCVAISAAQPPVGVTNANWTCVNRVCTFAGCKPNFWDLNGDKKCEYACVFSGSETCDGKDNDCDGVIDNVTAIPSPTQVCGVSGAATATECKAGASGVSVQCINTSAGLPCPNDPSTGMPSPACWQCKFPAGVCSGTTPCVNGNCCSGAAEVCEDQYNHAQPPTPSQVSPPTGGKDNNCNGLTNEIFANWGKPCKSDDGAPAPGDGQCQSTGFFYCNTVNTVACGARKDSTKATQEICDGADNDCDGKVDEAKSQDTNGNYVGQVGGPLGGDVATKFVKIGASLWIMAYEASRPSADTVKPGQGDGYFCSSTDSTAPNCNDATIPKAPVNTPIDKTVACSVANKIPWFNVTPVEAEQTCKNRGGQLCTTTQWQTGCESGGSPTCTWAYGPHGAACTSVGTAAKFCNMNAYTGFGDADKLLVTNSATLLNCFADWGGVGKAFDMTGNLREITKQAANVYPLMGGSFETQDQNGATCSFSFYEVNTTFQLYDTGFRCCFTSDPT